MFPLSVFVFPAMAKVNDHIARRNTRPKLLKEKFIERNLRFHRSNNEITFIFVASECINFRRKNFKQKSKHTPKA